MLGVTLANFGPDKSFAAAASFITSSVPRSSHGVAGSLLVYGAESPNGGHDESRRGDWEQC